MSTDPQAESIAALTTLHRGLDRKGPGDTGFVYALLPTLPALPDKPRIADLGCGSGASALLLAQHYQSRVMAVDASAVFIEELKTRSQPLGLESLILPICGDMGNLDWTAGSVDLLWSEGAAYNLGFEQALTCWRSLLADGGVAVISEMSWFTADAPEPAIVFWQAAYPLMGTEAENCDRAHRTGYHVLATHRLPSQAWWVNYYDPLRQRIQQMQPLELTPIMQSVIAETAEEMQLFAQFSAFYGYTFYVLQPA